MSSTDRSLPSIMAISADQSNPVAVVGVAGAMHGAQRLNRLADAAMPPVNRNLPRPASIRRLVSTTSFLWPGNQRARAESRGSAIAARSSRCASGSTRWTSSADQPAAAAA